MPEPGLSGSKRVGGVFGSMSNPIEQPDRWRQASNGRVTHPPAPAESILRAVRELPGVREVAPTADGARIRADAGAELLPRLFDVLRAGDVQVRLSRVTLEDVFIQMTGFRPWLPPARSREDCRSS